MKTAPGCGPSVEPSAPHPRPLRFSAAGCDPPPPGGRGEPGGEAAAARAAAATDDAPRTPASNDSSYW